MPLQTLVLIGDSILDNGPYTRPGPDSTAHLQEQLPQWLVRRLAQDGAIMSDIQTQLRDLNDRPSVAVLSIGGNDALRHLSLLDRATSGSADVLQELLVIVDDFGSEYESVARSVAGHAERTVLCTIYNVQLQPARYAELARVPIALLNDRIIQTAGRLGVDVLELRSVCTDPEDFVQQIEPSARGALKIASAIATLVTGGALLTSGRLFTQR
jgi:hypothetical protein